MPRVTFSYVPKYRFHKPSGQARVTIEGRDFWLGPWKSKASLLEYDRVINEWLANGRRLPAPGQDNGITVVELIAAYLRFAATYYRKQASGLLISRKMTWYGFQRIIEVDGEPTGDNYVAVTRLHVGRACAAAPEHGRTRRARRLLHSCPRRLDAGGANDSALPVLP